MSHSSATRPQRDPSGRDSATPESATSLTDENFAPPALLFELEPRHRVFFRNLGDLLLHRQPPPVETTAQPVPLRPEYFIRTGIDAYRFAESYAGHMAFIIVVYVICTETFFNRPPKLQSPFQNTKVEYYPVSDYLPPINTASEAPVKPRQGAPKLARQEILSVPPQADNNHQTIVTPPKVKLDHDVPLPNIVAWTPVPATQPIAASSRSVSQLKVPQFEAQVVAPSANVSQLKSKLPTLPQPSVVEPPLSPDQLKLQKGQLNMAQLQPQVEAPKLPVPAQRASGVGDSGATNVPPPANVHSLPASQGQGQLIALGLNPSEVIGPITVPSGNRSGEFHASPGGKANAPGTPNIVGTGNDASGGTGRGPGNGLPPGITVGAPPPGAVTSAVAGMPIKPPASNPDLEARKRMIAAAMKPSLPSYHDRQPPTPPSTLSDDPDVSIEKKVFRAKPYYSLTMNMPNLTSATGSWIIRFAELKETTDNGLLTAPVATTKVDPAYPPEVLRDHVEGTVTLYAVIRADGTVDAIRVLNSLDDRLDANAIHALSGWRFRPGTKNGEPVALEAVVQIPFRMRHLQ